MAIPNNIDKSHILKAIEKIKNDGILYHSESQYYDILFNGERYPPKLIISYANLFANGEILDRNSFSGGINTKCFKLLETNGFKIVKKNMSYNQELKKFLEQAWTGELKTSGFQKEYLGFKVKVSFGQGNVARVPWIAFLNDIDTVQNGIYPVYLLYKEKNLLILAYGVSETNKSTRTWGIENGKTLNQFFSENKLGIPERYGSSFVYKTYSLNKKYDEKTQDKDLNNLLSIYDSSRNDSISPKTDKMKFDILKFDISISNAGLVFSNEVSCRFVSSLLSKPFVILTGLSGSGKTKLAQAFAMWISENDAQYKIVPVGADWTNREPLLGFPNALQPDTYVKPDSGVLDLIIRATQDESKPYFLILDEMNLSHVERYFADFLSTMESGKEILLHAGKEKWGNVPPKIALPKNLFIVGTVNIDETTYMFSPKVLDRASVIEFRVTADEMESYLNQSGKVDLDALKGFGASIGQSFVELAQNKDLIFSKQEALNQTLVTFFSQLKVAGAEFGYRTASEIRRFAAVAEALETNWTTEEILDVVIMQKLLPKLHGSRKKLVPVLETLIKLCIKPDAKPENYYQLKSVEDKDMVLYPIALEKLQRMYRGLLDNGFTSYAEA